MNGPDTPSKDGRRPARAAGAALGINLTAGMVFFAGGGYLLDKNLGTGQAATLAGMFLGLIYIGYEIWKFVKASESS